MLADSKGSEEAPADRLPPAEGRDAGSDAEGDEAGIDAAELALVVPTCDVGAWDDVVAMDEVMSVNWPYHPATRSAFFNLLIIPLHLL